MTGDNYLNQISKPQKDRYGMLPLICGFQIYICIYTYVCVCLYKFTYAYMT